MHVVQCLSTYKYSMNYLYVVAYFIYFTSQRPSEIKRGNHRRTVAGGSNGGRGRTGLGLGERGLVGLSENRQWVLWASAQLPAWDPP